MLYFEKSMTLFEGERLRKKLQKLKNKATSKGEK